MPFFKTLSTRTRRQLLFAPFAIGTMLVIGSIGFRSLGNHGWLDAIYLAAQTVTTVGYGDITLATRAERLFATVYMILGVGTVLYSLTVIAQAIVQSELIGALTSRRKRANIEKMQDHYIVCGAGRVGRRVIRYLVQQGLKVIVIESDPVRLEELRELAIEVLEGDATIEANLLQAGVAKAKGLAACLPDDASNVYVVLTARGLNPSVHIVSRAVEEQAEPTLLRAGASRVVAPTIIGGQSMARALIKPAIADFMDTIVAETHDLVFEEFAVASTSVFCGKRLSETHIGSSYDLIIVGIRRAGGHLVFHPSGETRIEDGDLLLVIGTAEGVKQLKEANN
ncbi:MAG: potassium channel protein [Acidobacteria bacterium]|nr:potassium channel protein [Acidobacteriota bacterium]